MRGAICGPTYLEVKIPVEHCPTCERPRRMLYRLAAWCGAEWDLPDLRGRVRCRRGPEGAPLPARLAGGQRPEGPGLLAPAWTATLTRRALIEAF